LTEQEIVRALITVGAVILGFLLGQFSDWQKTKKASSSKERSIKKLISLEIKLNISRVKNYWDKVLDSHETWETDDGGFMYTQLAEAAVKNPLPLLTSNAWKSNLGEIVAVYNETELEKLWDFQNKLERLYSLHSFFADAVNERRETRRFHDATHGSGAGMFISSFSFVGSVNNHAPEFKAIVDELLNFNSNS
tara:strand:+ start:759 stop:1337 length:579 start_codon:yes stop_codon:yes gene_type:complete